MTTQQKIHGDMTTFDAVVTMSEGNPGAITVLTRILKEGAEIDPHSWSGLAPIFDLDSLGVRGSRIWQLYKDVCGQKLDVTLGVLRAWQLGFLSTPRLLDAIGDDTRRGKPLAELNDLLAQVKAELPDFKVEVVS